MERPGRNQIPVVGHQHSVRVHGRGPHLEVVKRFSVLPAVVHHAAPWELTPIGAFPIRLQ